MAQILAFSGRPAEAIGWLEKAGRHDPRRRDLYLGPEGFAYISLGRYKEAIPLLKRHLTRYPNNVGSHISLAVSDIELGREDEARAEAAEVLRISPNYSLELGMQRAPIKDQRLRDRYYADLRKAGLK